MRELPQFIPVRVVDGRKLPVNTTGSACDPHDPANWLTYEAAMACNFDGVGFVLTANDPYFCVDLDKCLMDDGNWSPTSLAVVQSLPGAEVELSYSGRGLHIWGRYSGMFPAHACKNIPLGLELYHEKRFILLGTGQNGNAELDFTAHLPTLISTWFNPANAGNDDLDGWTEGPVDEWTGTDNDEELIRKACSEKKSPGQILGSVADV